MRCAFRLLFLALAGLLIGADSHAADKPNILMIAVDDLNHWVGHLGRNPQTRTPNMDALAARGVTFTRAYCAAPACNPSRAALMTGVRPATSGVYHNPTDWRPFIDQSLSLNTTLRKGGYALHGVGKIYHGKFDRKKEWDTYPAIPVKDPEPAPGVSPGVGGIRFAPLNCKDEDLEDYHIANEAIEQLKASHDKPFMISCGFHKPHMPWNVPQKYYDMFPLESIQLPDVQANDLSDVPRAGVKIAKPEGDHRQILESGRWKDAVQGYLAAIAYLDMNVGRVLKALDESPYRDNTVIVLWGDHGWHLGEKEHWRKFALWEEACRMPFIWVAPGVTRAGGVCHQPVDLMALYPTLCELSGTPVPEHVEGTSLLPLLKNPADASERIALTTHGQNNHAVRSARWRYIRYHDGSEELYDHQADEMEWTNMADRPELASVKADLKRHLPVKNVDEVPVTPEPNQKPGNRARQKL